MKKILIALCFLSISFSYGQQSRVDSLTLEFNQAKEDTVKVRLLAEIGVAAYRVNGKLAKVINDSLIRFAEGKSERFLAQGYRMRGTLTLLDGNYDTSLIYYTKSLEIFKKIGLKELEAALYSNLGTLYGRKSEREKAKEFYKRAIALNEKEGFLEGNIRPYINLAITVGQTNDLEEAVDYLIKALAIAEETDSQQNLGHIHNQMAVNYLKLDRYEKAEIHLKEALSIAENIENNYTLATVHNSLGYLYETRDDDFEKTLFHYEKSLYYHTLMNNKPSIVEGLYNVGLQYIRFEKFKKAEDNFFKGLIISDSLDVDDKKILGNLHLAHLYSEQGNIDEANNYISTANNLIGNDSRMPYKNHFYRIGESFAKQKKFKSAYENMETYAILADSLFKENGVDKIAEIETKYETEKKEKENLALKTEKAEQELVTEKANKQIWMFGIGLIASLIALSIFAFYYRKNKKQKNIIENLHKELHHRVKNNLSIIDTFIEVAKEEFSNDAFDKKLTELQNRIDSINEVHLQLYKNSDVTRLDVNKYIKTLSQNVGQSFSQKNITINHNIADTLSIDADKSFPIGLIVNEFLTNSYKYAFENRTGNIDITLRDTGTDYELLLSDNGRGLPENLDIEKTSTFGLRVMKLLSKELNGTFKLSSNKGVQLNIHFPK